MPSQRPFLLPSNLWTMSEASRPLVEVIPTYFPPRMASLTLLVATRTPSPMVEVLTAYRPMVEASRSPVEVIRSTITPLVATRAPASRPMVEASRPTLEAFREFGTEIFVEVECVDDSWQVFKFRFLGSYSPWIWCVRSGEWGNHNFSCTFVVPRLFHENTMDDDEVNFVVLWFWYVFWKDVRSDFVTIMMILGTQFSSCDENCRWEYIRSMQFIHHIAMYDMVYIFFSWFTNNILFVSLFLAIL